MRRHFRKQNKFTIKLNIFKILSILLICVFVLFIPSFIKLFIKISTIECLSQYGQCPEDLERNFKSYESKDYYKVSIGVNKILNESLLINNYLIQYKIPNKLKVEITLKKPKVSFKDPNNIFYLVDENGYIVTQTNESSLPVIVSKSSYKIGERVVDKDQFALKLIEKLSYLFNIRLADRNDNELVARSNEGIIIHFPLEGDVDVLIGSLRLIFSRLNQQSQGTRMEDGVTISDVKEIDLRFKNPVLR